MAPSMRKTWPEGRCVALTPHMLEAFMARNASFWKHLTASTWRCLSHRTGTAGADRGMGIGSLNRPGAVQYPREQCGRYALARAQARGFDKPHGHERRDPAQFASPLELPATGQRKAWG